MPAPRRKKANVLVHRALARARMVRLKIWRGLAGLDRSRLPAASANEGEIAILYRTEASRLRHRIGRRLPPDRAADVVQSAFLRLLTLGADRFAAIGSPPAYLSRVTDNVANEDGRRAVRRADRFHVELDEREITTCDPHQALEARDMLRRLEVAIETLPDQTREIFIAHRFEDLTYPQIAERVGLSVKSVEYHISAALRALHRVVGDPS